jgi:hypothetical protein
MLSYPAAIPLSTRTLNHLAGLIRRHRDQHRSRWRRLDSGRQALLALAHLRNGDTYTRLACRFEIGVATAWRYVREAVNLFAAAADDLSTAMGRIRALAYAILDGIRAPAAPCGRRSNATATGRNCPAGRRPSTAPTRGSAPSVNAPTPLSRPGKSWSSYVAAHAERPRSCGPSSSCTTSRTPTYRG